MRTIEKLPGKGLGDSSNASENKREIEKYILEKLQTENRGLPE